MRNAAVMILMTGTLMACGGSGDVCQQSESLLQSEANKVQSCGSDAGADESLILADLTNVQQNCETDLKSCTAADMSALSGAVSCEQSLVSTIQCQWFLEADTTTDPSFVAYQNATTTCEAKTANVSAACGGGTM